MRTRPRATHHCTRRFSLLLTQHELHLPAAKMEARTILLVIVALLVVPATATEIEVKETDVLLEPVKPEQVRAILADVKDKMTGRNLQGLVWSLVQQFSEEQIGQRTEWPSEWPQPVAEAQRAEGAEGAAAGAEGAEGEGAEAAEAAEVAEGAEAAEAAEEAEAAEAEWAEADVREAEKRKKIEEWNECLEQKRAPTSVRDFTSYVNAINYKVHTWKHEVQTSERRVELLQEILQVLKLHQALKAEIPSPPDFKRDLQSFYQLHTDMCKLDKKLYDEGILGTTKLGKAYSDKMWKVEQLEKKMEQLEKKAEKLQKAEQQSVRKKRKKLQQKRQKLQQKRKELQQKQQELMKEVTELQTFFEMYSGDFEQLKVRMRMLERNFAAAHRTIGNEIGVKFYNCIQSRNANVQRSGNRLNGIKSTDNAVAALMVLSLAVAFIAPLAFVLRKRRQKKGSKRKTL